MNPTTPKHKLASRRPPSQLKADMSRRHFLRTTALGGAGLLILKNSRSAYSYEANSKLNVAAIGISGRGRGNVAAAAKAGENIVALL